MHTAPRNLRRPRCIERMPMSTQQQQVMNDLLIEAVRGKDVTQAALYVQKGADAQVKVNMTEYISTPSGSSSSSSVEASLLHLTVSGGSMDEPMIDFLLKAGVDIDSKNSNGNTLLMLAVKTGNAYRAKYFLRKGADPLAVNAKGEMVLQQAQRLPASHEKRIEIINALLAKTEDRQPTSTAAQIQDNKQEVTVPQGKIDVMKPVSIGRKPQTPGSGNGFEL